MNDKNPGYSNENILMTELADGATEERNTQVSQFSDSGVLVTGGLGFIGSNLAIKLIELGARVTIVDCRNPKGGANDYNIVPIRDRVKLIDADIGNYDNLSGIVNESQYVFDLAAQVSHLESMASPRLDLEMNCAAHLELLEAIRKSAANPKLIYTGSRVQYGRITRLPVREDHPIDPVDNNGISKHAYEQYCLLYHRTYGVRASSLRITNTYGPRNVMRHARQGFVNWFVRLAIDSQPIEIFGDGKQKREYSYVDDVVDACLMCATKDNTNGNAYNVGGFPSSVLDVAKTLAELKPGTEILFRPFPGERKPIEIGDYYSDYTRLSESTGWKPTTPLKEGLRRTIEFYETSKKHYW